MIRAVRVTHPHYLDVSRKMHYYVPLSVICIILLIFGGMVLYNERNHIIKNSKHSSVTLRWDSRKIKGIQIELLKEYEGSSKIIGGISHSKVDEGQITVDMVINQVVDLNIIMGGIPHRRVSIQPGDHALYDLR